MKLYVGNLTYSITEEQLQDVFGEQGNVVSVKIIKDKFTGNPKGFGFVEMGSDDEANAAIDALNGREIEGRQMKVSKARPPQPRAPRQHSRY